jgi:hypothetical protein
MVEPLHAKKGPAATLEERPLSMEKAAARKRNMLALMRRQGYEFADPPLVPAPTSPALPLAEARAAVVARIDELANWLKARTGAEKPLALAPGSVAPLTRRSLR